MREKLQTKEEAAEYAKEMKNKFIETFNLIQKEEEEIQIEIQDSDKEIETIGEELFKYSADLEYKINGTSSRVWSLPI